MIQLTFDLVTGTVKLSTPATIVVGADVPISVTFSTAPGDIGGIQVGLGTDAAPPLLKAYTDTFTQQSDTVWTGTLDASDTRLVSLMAASNATTLNLEFTAIIDGEKQIAPHAQVTVQPAIIPTDPTSVSGPSYYTETESDARYLQISAAFTQAAADARYAEFLGTGFDLTTLATIPLSVPRLVQLVTGSPQALQVWMLRAGTDASDGVGVIHPADYNASTNAKVFIRVA